MAKYIVTAGLALILVALVLVAGCANTLYPPEAPDEPRTMYLLDVGRHTRLAFGLPDGGFVEYGYGEWLWYARLEDQWWRVPAVLFWPTEGTLGRREWTGSDAEGRLLREYAGLNVLELPAEAEKVAAVVARLERAFRRRSAERVYNRVYELHFVPSERSYSLLNNSNHAVKEWLQETGYKVRGSGIFARWQLADDES